jgi:hypothetical protein
MAPLGPAVIDNQSLTGGDKLQEFTPEDYYTNVRGFDGEGLRVPSDLDESICRYFDLAPPVREKFDRAAFWLDLSSKQWSTSISASFVSVVSAIESLLERGSIHSFCCPVCQQQTQHETPGATRRFRHFFDTYAPSTALASRKNRMYDLRSGIVHGSKLMELDRQLAIGIRPRDWSERELNADLRSLTGIALRNWLRAPT